MCVFFEKESFYTLFPPGRHACGGQSQLDMPERFLLERKMRRGGVGGGTSGKRETAKKKELSIEWARDKDHEREGERETL